MHDMLICPICNAKLRNIRLPGKYLYGVGKIANYIERTCVGMNHSLQLFADESTNQVDWIKISLNPKYSKFIEIDFLNQKCRIICTKNSKPEYININKMIEPDFPSLEKLKEKINLYVAFS
jgi:hypothetical protein